MDQQQNFAPFHGDNDPTTVLPLNVRLDALEQKLAEMGSMLEGIHELLEGRQLAKESYTTAEVAKILGKRPYTVREWCRLGRVNAYKAECGRGIDEEWRISREELIRIQNEGLLEARYR